MNLIYNSQNYDSGKYGDDEIVKDRLTSQYIFMNPDLQVTTINEIQRQSLQSEESLFNFLGIGVGKEWYKVIQNVETL